MRSIQKMICIMLVLTLSLCCSTLPSFAAEETSSGTCGESLTWILDGDGLLTISGTGEMENYASSLDVPWYDYTDAITAVVIEPGVTTIGDRAFYFCESLTAITIPDGVTRIGDDALYQCSGLTELMLPESLIAIGDYAFSWCGGLTDITLPAGVTTIGANAFAGCEGLTGIVIPASVTSIGTGAFSGCAALEGIWVDESNASYHSDDCGVLFDKAGTTLLAAPGTLSGSYPVPAGVITIGGDAFFGCADLTAVTLPEGVTTIGTSAFEDCGGLSSITLPDSLTDIGDYAFSKCEALTGIALPQSLTEIGCWVFESCYSLKSITVPAGVTAIGEFAFFECTSLKDITFPEGLTHIGSHIFYRCQSLQTVTLPEGVTDIPSWAFGDCYALESITIPGSVTAIGAYAFQYDTALTTIEFRGAAPTIDETAFGSVTATALYPANQPTWTADVMLDYGGTITWEPYGDPGLTLDTPVLEYCYSRQQTSVRVKWSVAAGAEGYELWRSTTPETPDSWTRIKTITDGTADTYTNQGLTVGVTYYYKVRAYATAEDGSRIYSAFSNVDYMPASVVFDAPYSNATFRIRLRWNEVSGATGYQIWRQNTDGTYSIIKTLGDKGNELTDDQGGTTIYSNTGLTPGERYTYKLRSFAITADGRKIYGAYSDEITVAVMPETPVVTVTSPKEGRAKLSWEGVNGAAGYQIWMSTDVDSGFAIAKSITDGSTAYTKYDLESGKTYYFKVRAYVEEEGKKTFGAYSETIAVTIK